MSTATSIASQTLPEYAPDVARYIDDRVAAASFSISRAHLHRLRAAGRFPAGVKLGRALRFDREELLRWGVAGCPDMTVWHAMQEQARRTRRP
ncbi:MAG: helix-turn-helix domain-containing protein [Gemmataceae bacterium]|nr:helix-turn-helix domain-containing protein [Gemmataceae bacterium]